MSYYGAKELADSFRTVRKNTITVAEDIPEDKYGLRGAPETRTVAQMLVHIAVGPRLALQIHRVERRTALEGFDFPGIFGGILAEEQKPRSKAGIVALLHTEGDALAQWLEGLSDAFLAERVTLPPGMTPASKTRFEMLLSSKEHEMHHRSQLMLIERMVGIVPHLTLQMQERMAAMQARTAPAGAPQTGKVGA
jgi:uncharacterized damage-inducible protein DinB